MNRMKMKTELLFISWFLLIGVAAYAAEPASEAGYKAYGVREMLGTYVKNVQGDTLGTVQDIVIDSNGRAAFIILSVGLKGTREKLMAVPFNTLSLGDGVLNVSRERLESTPAFDERDLRSLKKVEDIYRHFGQQPYWNEGGETPGPNGLPINKEWLRHNTSDFDEMG